MTPPYFVHDTASIAPEAVIGDRTQIWQHCQVREGAVIGEECILGKGVYIDARVHIGSQVKIQNYVSVYEGVTMEDGVFCGPHCVFTNDRQPRAINPDGSLKRADDWTIAPTLVRIGAAIGANATIVCGVTVGRWAMVGAGAVVTRDIPDYGLVYGNPARLYGFVCPCGARLSPFSAAPQPLPNAPDSATMEDGDQEMACLRCQRVVNIPHRVYAKTVAQR
jgi:UDP-2-acetamido-3-amino-2,3-dideoxy-glucuronate N-acetyltransferase